MNRPTVQKRTKNQEMYISVGYNWNKELTSRLFRFSPMRPYFRKTFRKREQHILHPIELCREAHTWCLSISRMIFQLEKVPAFRKINKISSI